MAIGRFMKDKEIDRERRNGRGPQVHGTSELLFLETRLEHGGMFQEQVGAGTRLERQVSGKSITGFYFFQFFFAFFFFFGATSHNLAAWQPGLEARRYWTPVRVVCLGAGVGVGVAKFRAVESVSSSLPKKISSIFFTSSTPTSSLHEQGSTKSFLSFFFFFNWASHFLVIRRLSAHSSTVGPTSSGFLQDFFRFFSGFFTKWDHDQVPRDAAAHRFSK